MNLYCPRCRLPLHADIPRGQPSLVTCPSCLELITVHPPAPIPAIPIEQDGRSLEYRGLRGDVEAELQKDMQSVLIGIMIFAVTAIGGYFVLKFKAGLPGPTTYWLGWIGLVTTVIAVLMLTRHARRGRRMRAGELVRPKTTGERAAAVIVLGISGLLFVGLTLIAALVLLLAACLFAAGMH
jgi:hypothetical protein